MTSDFSINTRFSTEQANNSISSFNKNFDSSFKNSIDEKDNGSSEFDKIFNSMSKEPLSASVSVEAKTNGVSPVEKTVNDIGNGIKNSLNSLNNIQRQAETDFETFASGGDISIHDVMISAQKSNLSLQMAVQLRNRMLNAYNEFKSMNV